MKTDAELLAQCPVLDQMLEGGIVSMGRLEEVRKSFLALARRFSAPIVCLCGSTRFKEAFDEANYQETMRGKIVLSVGFYMHATGNRHGESIGATPAQKIELDKLHKRKIDLADEVYVLDVDGYIGESTRSEIEYAEKLNKPIRYLSKEGADG